MNQIVNGTICPYLDVADIRCESRLSLGQLKDAFDLCICNYHRCPVYRQIRYEELTRKTANYAATGTD